MSDSTAKTEFFSKTAGSYRSDSTPKTRFFTLFAVESCLNLLRKAGFSEVEVRAIADDFYRRYSVAFIGRDTMRRTSLLREQHQFSFWDSMIFASAVESASPILYSEDMHNGLQIDGVRIVNPFRIAA
jgi:predicted nucleic acid-binding protein